MNPRGRSRRRRCLRTCLKSSSRDTGSGGVPVLGAILRPKPFRDPPFRRAQNAHATGDPSEICSKMRKPVRWDLKTRSPKPDYRVGISRAFSNPAPPSRFSNRFSSSACGAIKWYLFKTKSLGRIKILFRSELGAV